LHWRSQSAFPAKQLFHPPTSSPTGRSHPRTFQRWSEMLSSNVLTFVAFVASSRRNGSLSASRSPPSVRASMPLDRGRPTVIPWAGTVGTIGPPVLNSRLTSSPGGAKLAQLQRERASSDRVAAMRTAFEDQVRLEVRRAYYDHDSAQQQVAVAKAASEQAAESLRILSNRYDAGLATVTDLLRVEEAAHRAQSEYWDAVYRTQTTFANLQLAAGTLTPDSPAVMP
jgi:hypothetical protein